MHEPLPIIAVLTAKAGQRDALKRALKTLIVPSRAEPGCLNYNVFQLHNNPDMFYVYETWKGQQALDAHVALEHFQAFAEQMDTLLAEPLELVYLNSVEP
jgi:quinol monooxygenase YgiN